MDSFLSDFIETLFKIAFAIGINIGFFAPVLAWVERKQSAVMQDRIGANRAGIFGITVIGLFHSLADAIKLIFKEDFIPTGADRLMHTLAPVIAVIPALAAFAVIPFGGEYILFGQHVNLIIADLDVGVLFIFAITSLATYGVVIGGWASNNNWSLLGGLRASAQMFSYEVTMGLTIIGLVMYYQSLSLVEIVAKQENFWHWGIIWHWPAFILFFACAVAGEQKSPIRRAGSGIGAGGRIFHRIFRDEVRHVLDGGICGDGDHQRTLCHDVFRGPSHPVCFYRVACRVLFRIQGFELCPRRGEHRKYFCHDYSGWRFFRQGRSPDFRADADSLDYAEISV